MPWAQQRQLSPPPQGWESAYLAFPSAYLHYGQEVNNGLVEVRFAFSRNGTQFRLVSVPCTFAHTLRFTKINGYQYNLIYCG